MALDLIPDRQQISARSTLIRSVCIVGKKGLSQARIQEFLDGGGGGGAHRGAPCGKENIYKYINFSPQKNRNDSASRWISGGGGGGGG